MLESVTTGGQQAEPAFLVEMCAGIVSRFTSCERGREAFAEFSHITELIDALKYIMQEHRQPKQSISADGRM